MTENATPSGSDEQEKHDPQAAGSVDTAHLPTVPLELVVEVVDGAVEVVGDCLSVVGDVVSGILTE